MYGMLKQIINICKHLWHELLIKHNLCKGKFQLLIYKLKYLFV